MVFDLNKQLYLKISRWPIILLYNSLLGQYIRKYINGVIASD